MPVLNREHKIVDFIRLDTFASAFIRSEKQPGANYGRRKGPGDPSPDPAQTPHSCGRYANYQEVIMKNSSTTIQ